MSFILLFLAILWALATNAATVNTANCGGSVCATGLPEIDLNWYLGFCVSRGVNSTLGGFQTNNPSGDQGLLIG